MKKLISFVQFRNKCKDKYYHNKLMRCFDKEYHTATIKVPCREFNCPIWKRLKGER